MCLSTRSSRILMVCVSMRIYMYVWRHLFIHAHLYVRLNTCFYTCEYACMCEWFVCTYVHAQARERCDFELCVYMTYILTCAHAYIRYVHEYLRCVCAYTDAFIHTHRHMHARVYTYIQTFIHTYIHTYIHTCILYTYIHK